MHFAQLEIYFLRISFISCAGDAETQLLYLVTYTLFMSYIIAFCTSVGGVLMLYNCVLILDSQKAIVRFVAKSLLLLVTWLCQRQFVLRSAQHTTVSWGHTAKKENALQG